MKDMRNEESFSEEVRYLYLLSQSWLYVIYNEGALRIFEHFETKGSDPPSTKMYFYLTLPNQMFNSQYYRWWKSVIIIVFVQFDLFSLIVLVCVHIFVIAYSSSANNVKKT